MVKKALRISILLAVILMAPGFFSARADDKERPCMTVHGPVYAKDLPDFACLDLDGDTELITTGAAGKTITRIHSMGTRYKLTISGTASYFAICNDGDDWAAIDTGGLEITCSNLVISSHNGYPILMRNEGEDVTINCGSLQIYSESNFGISCSDSDVYVYGGNINVNVDGAYGIYGRNVYLYGGNLSLNSTGTAVRSSTSKGFHTTLAIAEPSDGVMSTDQMTIKDSHNSTVSYAVLRSSSTAALYTVTFDRNGHGSAPIRQKIWENGYVARPASPQEDGFELVYWVTDLNYKIPYQYMTRVTENRTLYGLWNEQTEGSFGGNVTWKRDGEFLTVEGTGAMDVTDDHFTHIMNKDGIRFITVAEGVTSVGMNTLSDCYDLETVSLPSTMKTIELAAFENCPKLTAVNIPPDCRIEDNAFAYCGLRIVRIPKGATVGDMAFRGCDSLWLLQLPESPAIGSKAFADCNGLTKVLLSGFMTNVAEDAFEDCANLTLFCAPGSEDVEAYAISYGYDFANPTVLTLPAGLTTISAEAFAGIARPLLIKPLNQGAAFDPTAFMGCTNIIFVGLTGDGGEVKNWCLQNGYIFLLDE